MPSPAVDPEDLKFAEPQWTPPQPSPAQVSAMDRALDWLRSLPGSTPAEIRVRKIVAARMLVSPRTDRPLFSWRKLGDKAGVSHVWAKTLWLQAISDLTTIANRQRSAPCAGTLARIRAAALPASLRPVPLSSPCAGTVRRIQQGVIVDVLVEA